MDIRPFLIGKDWTQGGGQPFAAVNPVDGSEVARIAGANAADVDKAVATARAALDDPAWRDLKHHERARLLHRVADLIEADTDRLARAQMVQNGKTLKECRAQVASAAGTFRYYAAACEVFESEITTPRGNHVTMTVYEPIGVVGAITPWNSPLSLEAQKLAPILAGGNTVVLKPSEVTPLTALEYARIALEAGLPAGVVNVVTGAAEVGKALVEHAGVDMISFTGGTNAGRAIAEAAGRRLAPVVLELGGKSPHIVFADADLKRAAKETASGIFSGCGQSCIAGSRIFVQETILADFLESLRAEADAHRMGSPEEDGTLLGPLATFQHRDKVASYVEVGRAEGGRIVTGGEAPKGGAFDKGAFYPATIIADLPKDARVVREEIFGPVAVVLPFRDEADVIAQANDTEFGLAAGIWTGDYRKAWRVARAIRAGTVWINTYKELSISTPFGGFKQSGMGREKGLAGMRVYMEPKSLYWSLN